MSAKKKPSGRKAADKAERIIRKHELKIGGVDAVIRQDGQHRAADVARLLRRLAKLDAAAVRELRGWMEAWDSDLRLVVVDPGALETVDEIKAGFAEPSRPPRRPRRKP